VDQPLPHPQQPYPQPQHGAWQPQPGYAGYGPHPYPQPGYGHPPRPPTPRNGFAVTALVLAILGLLFSVVPFTGFVAILLGGFAVVFGLLGWSRFRRGEASPAALPVAGAVIGLAAVAVGTVGTVVTVRDAQDAAAAPPAVAAPAPAPSLPPVAAPPVAQGSGTVAAPGAFTWDDGLSVEVGAPAAVTFSEYACCPTGGNAGVAFTVRIVNGTDEVLEPYALLASLTADGVAADQVFDYENGFDGVTNSIPPGRDLTVTMAFAAAGSDLLLELEGLGRDPAFFTAIL
jgi:hypothetical protein